ncbi:MAG TPA: M1 family aminopeptidase [Actinopolymorphaceae bacterium]|jgi:hypothetical protein
MTGSAQPTRRSPRVVRVRWITLPVVAALLLLSACAPSAQRALGSSSPEPFPSFTPSPSESATPTPTPTANPQCPSPPSGGGGGGNDQGGGGNGSELSGPDTPAQIEPAALTGGRVDSAPIDKSKPSVTLCFAFSSDRTEANGREQVTFTPDLKVCQLVFRLWPNKAVAGSKNAKLTITKATVARKEIKPTLRAAGAASGAPGTLASLKLPACVKAGTELSTSLEFTLDLAEGTPERVGYDEAADVAWAGSAYPLLAWVPGQGWATEPAVKLYGETATSTAYDLSELLVVTNTGDTVMGEGTEGKVEPGANGTETHSFSAPSVRDVAVTVGSFARVDTEVDGIRVHLAIPSAGAKATSQQWSSAIAQGMRALTAELGTFPYPDVWLSVVPDVGGGIEFPTSVLYGDIPPEDLLPLVTHELAHQWFYALVGNDQAASPWLDEGFASYATAVALGDEKDYTSFTVPARVKNKVGESMSWYSALGNPDLYTAGVYQQGAKMLLEARAAAGDAKFTALTKAYIKADANKIATPAAVKKAYASSPAAIKVMQRYGALR